MAEDGWPRDATSRARTLVLGGDGRLDEAGEDGRLQIVGQQTAGLDAGSWCPYGEVADWPGDQRAMDGMSLTFTSDPLPERLEILGYPEVTLRLESDRPLALVIVRLCEVWPDGASTVVTRALQNLTHRESDEHPAALVPGRAVHRRRSASTRPGTRSRRGTASASASRRPTGRGRGRRRSR